ncbi:MAG: Xaa-Pro dipeptidase [Gammaproteobacteria bacterium]
MNRLYQAHIAELTRRYDEALQETKFEAVIITAGSPAPVFNDDQTQPFRANPYLVQWAPLLAHPDAMLCYCKSGTPRLYIYEPDDFWHKAADIPAILKDTIIEVSTVREGTELYDRASEMPRKTVLIGEVREKGDTFGISKVNPKIFLDHLNYQRSIKTPYEIACITEANRMAIPGHLAAEENFNSGGTEYDIQLAFRTACRVTDNEMPYPAIVALNEHAATLHYQHLDKTPKNNLSLLIDAGCSVNGYASDVTRTYSHDPVFGSMVAAMHELQQELCAAALPGVDFPELHHQATLKIASLLKEMELLTCSPDEAIETGIMQAFSPHGLGHFLGLQVHDVGSLQTDREGHSEEPPSDPPNLRLARQLEAGNVITVEPGVYFIDSLLKRLQDQPAGEHINWQNLAPLRRFGGIRIEDNLLITESGNKNLTRSAFAEYKPI